MIESGSSIFFSLSPAVIKSVRSVGVRQIVSGTLHGPARALAAVLCACAISWTRPDVVWWYRYEFMTGDLFVVPPRRSKQGKTCPGSMPFCRMRPAKLEDVDRMRAARESVQRETAPAAVEERRRWNRGSKAKKKRANARSGENVPVAQENVIQ